MALNTVVKHFTDSTITLADATGTPLTATTAFDDGTLQIDGLKAKLREVVTYQTKGVLRSVRHGQRTFPTVSFKLMFTEWEDDGSLTTVMSALLKQGTFASGVSQLGTGSDVVWALDLTFATEGTNAGDARDSTITLADVGDFTVDFNEGSPNMLSVTGTVFGAISGDLTIT